MNDDRNGRSLAVALLLPLERVAEMLGVCVRTIRREILRKRFPQPVTIGRRKLIPRAELEAYLQRKMDQRQQH